MRRPCKRCSQPVGYGRRRYCSQACLRGVWADQKRAWRANQRAGLVTLHGLHWRPEDDARLIELYASGRPHKQIAPMLRRSVNSVIRRVIKLGLPLRKRRSPDPLGIEQQVQLRALWEAGVAEYAICFEMGLGTRRMQEAVKQLGLAKRRRPVPPYAEIYRLRDGGRSYREICRALDIPVGSVAGALHRRKEARANA